MAKFTKSSKAEIRYMYTKTVTQYWKAWKCERYEFGKYL